MRRTLAYYAKVKDTDCPTCIALPGDWCWTKNGKPKSGYHADRIRAAFNATDIRKYEDDKWPFPTGTK